MDPSKVFQYKFINVESENNMRKKVSGYIRAEKKEIFDVQRETLKIDNDIRQYWKDKNGQEL